VVEVHAAEALLVVDGHSHLMDDRCWSFINYDEAVTSMKSSFQDAWIGYKDLLVIVVSLFGRQSKKIERRSVSS
jgi:hypothetical protein